MNRNFNHLATPRAGTKWLKCRTKSPGLNTPQYVEMMNRFSARALVLPDYALIVGRHGTGRNRYEYFMITKATKGTKQEELTLDGRVI